MAHKPLRAKTDFIQMPIPNISEIEKPAFLTSGIPVQGEPQPMRQYNRNQG
ncbi:MAG: hypothetical protein QF863_04050 [Pseudomonadales bacterium]|nr:hypothetical protein [Pseudomonadales bacterium]